MYLEKSFYKLQRNVNPHVKKKQDSRMNFPRMGEGCELQVLDQGNETNIKDQMNFKSYNNKLAH